MTDNHREDVEGHIRRLLDSVQQPAENAVVRPDDTGGHSRFGMFLDPPGDPVDASPAHDEAAPPSAEPPH